MRYIVGFILTIALIIFAFVLVFRGGGDEKKPDEAVKLVQYADTSTEVRLTIDYPVSANQTHRQIVTTVGRDEARIQVEQGYEGQIIREQAYANNETAYAHFLRALQVAGYTKGVKSDALRDWRGYCPEGRRYIMEIIDGSRTIQQYWATSCGKIGSFKGHTNLVLNLFRKQIPDYNKLTSGLH